MSGWHSYRFYYTDHLEVPLPAGHRFPMQKYRLLREALLEDRVIEPSQLLRSRAAQQEELLLAHSPGYVNGLLENTLPVKELRPIGLSWSRELLVRSYASVGGFIQASESALEDGYSAVLAGGTHHAHSDRGEGYCVFNDFAVAALRLLERGAVKKILILDLDVHQGNGNSSILGQRSDVFILSLHGEKNYPFRKVSSHLDVPLKEHIGDTEYLRALQQALGSISHLDFGIIFYQAGVDNLKEDTLGTLDLTLEGLMKRDRMVFEFAKEKGLPVAMAIGGGYADPIELTVEAHVNTFKMAKAVLG
ncbi:MAG TPA: histone deacetylase [Bacteriovoracaceae bacterium]|nr:histone deacetylase [Bacteriovoracaceae bacterium]